MSLYNTVTIHAVVFMITESPSECESEEEEAEEEGSESDWESEDDPDRLWCFCKKPFNNRLVYIVYFSPLNKTIILFC